MMDVAAVDIGNTSIKLSVGSDPSAECAEVSTVSEAVELCRRKGAEKVAFCTTRELSSDERELTGGNGWWQFEHGCRLPIKIRYKTPETLGRDRIAAAVAANRLFPGEAILVADVGTALTIDLLSAEGEFLGGNISPGIKMRLEALHKFTSRLPLVQPDKDAQPFGCDTQTAISSGAKWGVIYEIAGAFSKAKSACGYRRLIITGGGAPMIESDLAEMMEGSGEMELVRTLVLDGLKIAYLYNHDK